MRAPHRVIAAWVVAVTTAACREPPPPAGPIRLVDLRPEKVGGAVPATASSAPAPAPSPIWKSLGVEGLTVRDGRVAGRSATDMPILDLERPRVENRDTLHEVQIRARVSAGTDLAIALRNTDTVDLPQEADILRLLPWPLNTPVTAGGETQTYVVRGTASLPAAPRHVLVRPTNVAGATFEVESVRLVSRREHLASVPSGLGWHGLGEIYRETLVARAPETLRFDVTLPSRPHLQLAVGTIEDAPVRFRVSVRDRRASDARDEVTVLQRTVTTAHRWEPEDVDLSRFAGRRVALSLSLIADKAGTLGFWGAPAIRDLQPPDSMPRRSGAGARPQGVILIWADTLRRDHLPFYGYARPTAPALGRMAAEGTVFEDCITQAPWTKASGPSLMTSLYPTSHTVKSFNDLLPSSAVTLAETYRQAGYATLGLVSIAFAGKFTNLHQGYEEMHELGSLPERVAGSTKSARTQVDRLLGWLQGHRDTPFFILLHVPDPHSPFKPYPPYDTMWADPSRREEHVRQAEKVRPFIKNAVMRRFGMPERDELVQAGVEPEAYVAYEKDWYDGSIRAMDEEMGRLRERLAEMGLEGRTLVAFVSDHGEEFTEHGRMFHQQSVYGELANVPLFLWWPGRVPAGVRVPNTVQNIDLMPTLLELSGIAAPRGIQGASLVPLFGKAGGVAWRRPAVMEAIGRPAPTDAMLTGSNAIILDGWKLVHHVIRPAGKPEYELFDHAKDPLDRHDLAPQRPDMVARLSREMEAWRRMAEQARLKPDAATAREVSAEELERLRALGYVQ